jgi:hypothetical protein
MNRPPHAPPPSRARDTLLLAIAMSAGSDGWTAWADVRQRFRENYLVEPRQAETPERRREALKQALHRAWRSVEKLVDVDRRLLGDRIRLRPGARP